MHLFLVKKKSTVCCIRHQWWLYHYLCTDISCWFLWHLFLVFLFCFKFVFTQLFILLIVYCFNHLDIHFILISILLHLLLSTPCQVHKQYIVDLVWLAQRLRISGRVLSLWPTPMMYFMFGCMRPSTPHHHVSLHHLCNLCNIAVYIHLMLCLDYPWTIWFSLFLHSYGWADLGKLMFWTYPSAISVFDILLQLHVHMDLSFCCFCCCC